MIFKQGQTCIENNKFHPKDYIGLLYHTLVYKKAHQHTW